MPLPQGRAKGHKPMVINTDHTDLLGSRQWNSVENDLEHLTHCLGEFYSGWNKHFKVKS